MMAVGASHHITTIITITITIIVVVTSLSLHHELVVFDSLC
jgi:hypothetical protein